MLFWTVIWIAVSIDLGILMLKLKLVTSHILQTQVKYTMFILIKIYLFLVNDRIAEVNAKNFGPQSLTIKSIVKSFKIIKSLKYF